ncbi:hypothetical protein BBW65_05825 [Helicobacter enhydrae]|uniref:ShlB/FhaC/HecB family hemolysin secretion/activation protein n=1 Tax=Helicobacter enhydrae TaxID=222136 RepID=A0A1B1U6G3_9HELI|nr:ShlB/FhaC/HecB family hemolysin secretion/activation protein [Helicobacter enhydrae]ANV98348.1 hypothetical protein BBW65_05825 [Helicobacter enhydrae]
MKRCYTPLLILLLPIFTPLLFASPLNPSDLTERLNQQRKETLLYENVPKLKGSRIPKENLKDEEEINQLKKAIKKRDAIKTDAPCFEISEIRLESSLENFKKKFSFLDSILKSYTHQCLNQNDLSSLLDELKIASIQKGYVTTLFGLKPQNLKKGVLQINLESSVIGQIQINDPSLIAFWGKDFGLNVGDILNIEPLERGIYNYKRLRTLSPRFFIQALPSVDDVAQTQINIIFDQKKLFGIRFPFYFNASVDNAGSQGSGMYQTSFQAGLENVLSLNEVLNGYVVFSPKWKKNAHNFYSSLDFSIPFRRVLFSVSGSYAFYAYPLEFVGQSLKYHGYSANFDLKTKILAYMDNLNQVSVSLGLGKRWAKNFLETIELIPQRRNLTNVYASLDYLRYFQNGATLNLSLGIKQGIKALGSMSNFPSNEKNLPNFFYTLPTLDVYMLYPMSWGEHRLVYTSLLKTQVSRTQLYASEKMGLGGIYSVRGFDSNVLSGDFGVLNRNDLSYFLPSLYGVSFAPSLCVDMGYVKEIYTPSAFATKGFVSGGGIGVKISYKDYLQTQIWGYMPFYHSDKQRFKYLYLSLGVGF